MQSIEIIETSSYLPHKQISNTFLNEKFNLPENWIYKRTGIKNRYYITSEETIVDLAIHVAKDILTKTTIDVQKIGNIIVASTSSDRIMPGISFEVQKALNIQKCTCLDIVAGCSGFINAFNIARQGLVLGDTEYALVIGVETISKFLNFEDVGTSILLGDGAGATLIGITSHFKKYQSDIQSIGQSGDILTCHHGEKLYMNTKVIENIQDVVNKANETLDTIKYIIPHQSNIRILNSIAEKLLLEKSKIYVNLDKVGNTFCASIPIALDEMCEKKVLQKR